MKLDKRTVLIFLSGFFSSAAIFGVLSLVTAKPVNLEMHPVTETPAPTQEPSLKPAVAIASEISHSKETPLFQTFFSSEPDSHSAAYSVRAGDTLTGISKKNHVTVDLLKKINGLADDKLVVGRKLKIPTYKLSLVVDKSQNIMILKGDEDVLKTYVVSTGVNNSSPVGVFKITDKLLNPTWYKAGAVVPPDSPQNVLGTRWMGITKKGYGIHGTTEPEKLGQQVTAGCIRMKNEEVEELYGIVPPGTEVTTND